MALSDYLTDDEWDACFYASLGQHRAANFGESMRKTIDALLASGYQFAGLDEAGNKKQQISRGNPYKLCIWLGNPYNVDIARCLDNGRTFLQEYLPELVDESDEDWELQMTEAEKAKVTHGN